MLKFKHFFVLCLALCLGLAANAQTSANKPENGTSILAKPHVYQGNNNRSANVLLLKDKNPWSAWGGAFATDPNETLLTNLGISYTVANSSQIAALDFSPFTMIMIASLQDENFYTNYNASLAKFTDFVNAGGNMEIHTATFKSISTLPLLPGGGNLAGTYPDDFEYHNIVSLPAHPMMAGVSNPFDGNQANHRYFENLPAGTKVITRTQNSNQPTTIEYAIGAGVVVATTCTLEWAVVKNEGAASMLEDGIEYVIDATPPTIPVSNWAIILGIALIIGFGIFRFFR